MRITGSRLSFVVALFLLGTVSGSAAPGPRRAKAVAATLEFDGHAEAFLVYQAEGLTISRHCRMPSGQLRCEAFGALGRAGGTTLSDDELQGAAPNPFENVPLAA